MSPQNKAGVGGNVSEEGNLALAASKADKLFPGRTSLYVHEVAKALRVSARHIVNLIVEGEIGARDTGSGKATSGTLPRRRR